VRPVLNKPTGIFIPTPTNPNNNPWYVNSKLR
jgi:hypothetical protein